MSQQPLPTHLVGVMYLRVNSAGVLVVDGHGYFSDELPPPMTGPSVMLSGLPGFARHPSRITALVSATAVDWAEQKLGKEFRSTPEATRLLALVPARRGVRVAWLIVWTIISALLATAWVSWPNGLLRHVMIGSVLITLLVLWATSQEVKDRRRSRASQRSLPQAVAQYYPALPIYATVAEAASHYPVITSDGIRDLARRLSPTPQAGR